MSTAEPQLTSPSPAAAASTLEHKHRCGGCIYIWFHVRDPTWTDAQKKAAHTCANCGTELVKKDGLWPIYWGLLPPSA